MTAPRRLLLPVALLTVLAAACSAAPNPTPTPSPAATPVAVASPTPSTPAAPASPSATPSAPAADPSPSANPSPKPTTAPAVWSKAFTIKALNGCSDLAAVVDDAGWSHLALSCGPQGSEIRYATSHDGLHWVIEVFKAPKNRFEQDPQLAIAGSTLYLATTRLAPVDPGCGDDGLSDVGVYVRSRALPDGAWTDQTKIGATADHIQSLRATSDGLHAIVTNEPAEGAFYEHLSGGALARVRVGDSSFSGSLRIGDDGVARVAFGNGNGIRFGRIADGKLSAQTIPGTDLGANPVLILAPGNVAHVLWTRGSLGGGCIDDPQDPKAGTYLSTNVGGSWSTTRLTRAAGGASLTMDPASGEVTALVGDFNGLRVFEQHGSSWTNRTLTKDFTWSSAVRRNPATGGLFVAYVRENFDDNKPATVEVVTKG